MIPIVSRPLGYRMMHSVARYLIVTLLLTGLSATVHATCDEPESSASAEEQLNFARCLFKKQNYDGVAWYLEQQVAAGMQLAQAYRLLGETYIVLGRYESARVQLEQAYALDADDPWTQSSLASALFHRALQLSPTQVQGLTESLPAECQPTEAVTVQADRGQSLAYIERAYALSGEAITAFAQQPILVADKQAQRGMMLVEMGRFEEAISTQVAAAELLLDYAESANVPERNQADFARKGAASIYGNLANQMLVSSRFQEAREYAALALAVAPDDAAKANVRALVRDAVHASANADGRPAIAQLPCGRAHVKTTSLELDLDSATTGK